MVNNETLANIIDEWDIAKYLLLSKSDIKNEVAKETKVKADLFEAIIGAIAVVSGWDAEILETAVSTTLGIDAKIDSMIEDDSKVRQVDMDNAITTLKELAEQGQCTMPTYEFYGPSTFGLDGELKWSCLCRTTDDKIGLTKNVVASSKKDAKKAAAYLILCEHLGVQNRYGPNDWIGLWAYQDGKLSPIR